MNKEKPAFYLPELMRRKPEALGYGSLLHFTFFILYFSFNTNAQTLKGITFEPNIHYGRIIKHTAKFTADVSGNTIGIELNLIKKTYGREEWQAHQDYPSFGVAVSYFNFGDKAVFGAAIGAVPNFTFKFLEKKRLHAHFRVGAGLAYLTQPFNIAENPSNNAIGSHMNGMVTFRLGTGYQLNEKWTLQSSLSYTHFSNGASSLPNLGLNIPALNLGFTYIPQPLQSSDFLAATTPRTRDPKIQFSLMQAFALTETITPGGPKFPVHITAISAGRNMGYANRLWAGLEYEFNYAVFDFMNHIGQFETQQQRRRNATRLLIFVADEVTLGNTSMWFQAGTYLTRSFLQPGLIYAKLGVRYHFRFKDKKTPNLHLGVYMKSHQVVAEHLSIGLGLSL